MLYLSGLSVGERLAGLAGVALLAFAFGLNWYSVEVGAGFAGVRAEGNAWEWFSVADIVLAAAAAAGIALAGAAATDRGLRFTRALAVLTAALGTVGTGVLVYRLIDPPDAGLGELVDVTRELGALLGLIGVSAIAVGGGLALREQRLPRVPAKSSPN